MTDDPDRVLVLSRTDFLRARSRAAGLLIDHEVRVLPVPPRPDEEQNPLYRRLSGRPRPGTLLTRNIWRPAEYVVATRAYEELSLQKFILIASVCQRLGATTLDVEEAREVAQDGRVTFRGKLAAAFGRGSASWQNETSAKLAERLKAHWSWPGNSPDLTGATDIVRRTGLDGDDVVAGLLDERGYDRNPLTEHRLELNISSEAIREVQAAIKVQSLASKLGPSFEADLAIMQKQTSSLRLDLKVTFG